MGSVARDTVCKNVNNGYLRWKNCSTKVSNIYKYLQILDSSDAEEAIWDSPVLEIAGVPGQT